MGRDGVLPVRFGRTHTVHRTPIAAVAVAVPLVSATPIGLLLMDQRISAGVGNIFRAEVLYRHRIDPMMQGRLQVARLYNMTDDPGVKDIPGMARLGYPIAEVDADGHCTITKAAGTGGPVSALARGGPPSPSEIRHGKLILASEI